MKSIINPKNIIKFWYSPVVQKLWYKSTPEFDQQILETYQTLWKQATQGELDRWQDTVEGCQALAIVLVQFPLNMFRGKALSFSSEQKAVEVSRGAIERGYDKLISKDQLVFLYVPLMHSEVLADQELSLQLFKAAGLKNNIRFAIHHRDLIKEFGRFPHRNALLGRQSTLQEIAYLGSKRAFTG